MTDTNSRDERAPVPAGAEPNGAHDEPAHGVSRREALGYLATLPLAGALEIAPPTLERAMRA
ncbi:MAG: hypothetical protein KGL93_02400, partial [Gemmatimonadota bacterium]|nr:hypothetical protein [Gemmatimonadota bacterium]